MACWNLGLGKLKHNCEFEANVMVSFVMVLLAVILAGSGFVSSGITQTYDSSTYEGLYKCTQLLDRLLKDYLDEVNLWAGL